MVEKVAHFFAKDLKSREGNTPVIHLYNISMKLLICSSVYVVVML